MKIAQLGNELLKDVTQETCFLNCNPAQTLIAHNNHSTTVRETKCDDGIKIYSIIDIPTNVIKKVECKNPLAILEPILVTIVYDSSNKPNDETHNPKNR